MKHLSQFIAIVLFIGISPALGFIAQFAPHALAQDELPPTIIVNTTLDDLRGCPERCTLRSAIATASPGDVIGFDPVVSGVLVLAQPLVIDKDLTINGPGADVFAIDGSERFRVLEIPAGVTVSISRLTIQNAGDSGIYNAGTLTITDSIFSGNTGRETLSYPGGGGIHNEGNLTITRSTFSNNTADNGGGIYNNRGDLSITNSNFTSNSALLNGSGIYNKLGTLSIADTVFAGNSAYMDGGGVYNESGRLTIMNGTFTDNIASDNPLGASRSGGGIFNKRGECAVTNSIFSGNSASIGGGISNENGSLSVAGNTFTNNSANNGGGIHNTSGSLIITDSIFTDNSVRVSGGGVLNANGPATITNSTFSNNSAASYGGGASNDNGNLTIVSSTFTDNSANQEGGGINNYQSMLLIVNSTFSGNSTNYGGAISTGRRNTVIVNSTLNGNSANIRGGGVFIGENGAIDLSNSIVAGNTAAEGPDIFGEVNSLSGNLVGDPQGALGLWASDLLEGDLLLGPLADNGGPTQTIALLPGSPAIDAISAEYCVWDDDSDPDTPPVPLLTDQRGAPRTGPCDIGAFEFGAVPPG